ncbi:MAG: glycosyltransferase family 4 protein [candidate division WOR-3 bacterium]
MRQLRIIQCSDAYYPFPGGVTEHLHHLSVALRGRGHHVDVLTAGYEGAPEHEEGVIRVGRIRILKAAKAFNLTQLTLTPITPDVARRVKEIVRSGYDIIHVHGPYAPNLPFLAARAALCPVVATHHTAFVGFNWHKIGRFFFRPLSQRIDANVGVSRVAIGEIFPYYPGHNYCIIPNGVDTSRFRPDVQKIEKLVGIKGPKILYVGRMEPRKGFPHILEAFKVLKRELPDAVLVACGKGPNLELYRESVPSWLKDSVLFEGFIPAELLPSYYASCDLYTSPAVGGETFGIVLVEAMACGTPVVASQIPGYAQVIESGINGILTDIWNPETYAKDLIRVLVDTELYNKLRREGLKTADKYSWPRIAEQVEALYYRILNARERGELWYR